MRNIIRIVIFLLVLTISFGCAGRTKPIYNIENHSVNYDLSLDDVEKAILTAGVEKGWTMSVVKPGLIDANLTVRTHKVHVNIDYSENAYSITYLDSENLLYKEGKIHRNYNRWIVYLDQRIQANLLIRSSN